MGARLAAFFGGADLVTRLGHPARLPQTIMFSAVALANHLASAIARLATSFFGHFSPIQHRGRSTYRTLRPQTPSLRLAGESVAAQLLIVYQCHEYRSKLKFRF
jgi:hypothetical protein